MSPPHFVAFEEFMTVFVEPLRQVATNSERLDGLQGGATEFRPMARFDYLGHTWGVDGDTHFEPLELAYRAIVANPSAEPFTIGRTGTRLKLVLRADLDRLRHDRGRRDAAYLYVYAADSR